jgi:LysM repeat protein
MVTIPEASLIRTDERKISGLDTQKGRKRGIDVRNFLHWLLIALFMLLLAACTRDRPTPTPAATTTPLDAPVIAPVTGADPAVEQAPAAELTATPDPSASPTADPSTPETFNYPVAAGDTLNSIALKFETDVQTIRQLNFLVDDNIFVGQVLQVPYKEGMTAEGAPTPTPAPFVYTIAPGDTLSSVASQFGVTTVAIIEANGLLDPNSLVVGQEIVIPGYQAPAGQTVSGTPVPGQTAVGSAGGVTHVVQPGEGLLEIAQAYGVDVNVLAQVNNITNRNLLRAGQQLVIPGLTPQEAARRRGQVHVVQAGEGLISIANQYGVSVDELRSINNISDPNAIYVGQELIIPGP